MGVGAAGGRERRRWGDVLERFSIVVAPLSSEVSGRPLYRSLWNSCTGVERLVLVHVAEEGFANPRQTQIVERLLRRGLLTMTPDLRPFHPAFRQFIEGVYERPGMAKLGAWHGLDASALDPDHRAGKAL